MGGLHLGERSIDAVIAEARAWRELGASAVAIRTVDSGLSSVGEHVKALAALLPPLAEL